MSENKFEHLYGCRYCPFDKEIQKLMEAEKTKFCAECSTHRKERINKIQLEATSAKFMLIEALDKLVEINAKREADALASIIDAIETWQNM